jgi:phospholipase C
MRDLVGRRSFLGGAAAVTALAAMEPWRVLGALAAPRALPNPADAPFDHVVVLMMENRSFDHFLGWLPGADGVQSGRAYWDTSKPGKLYPTYQLAPDYMGCDYGDPDHSWEGGVKQLNGGKVDGFLQTALPDDTFPIGYYTEESVPVLGALARSYTTSDHYFCSILAETYPNRFYQHAAATDRDHNNGTQNTALPTIWDRVSAAGLSGRYYCVDLPLLGLWGTKYAGIINPVARFLADAASGTLPNLAFVDPKFLDEGTGTSIDDHPHADIRAGEFFISQIYEAVRNSPNWDRTVFIINYDEWGGFYDHVVPPKVIDTTTRPASWGAHPDYRQLGFRVPNVVISPFSAKGVIRHDDGLGPYEHTSVLKMIEWRWGLQPLTDRDKNARNLAELLDFSLQRTDVPAIPQPLAPPAPMACGVNGTSATRPAPIAVAGGATPGSGTSGAGATGGASNLPTTSAQPARGGPAVAALGGAAGLAAAAVLRRRGATKSGAQEPATKA